MFLRSPFRRWKAATGHPIVRSSGGANQAKACVIRAMMGIRMADWSDGYITNIEYTSGFYAGLSPILQNFSLLYRGLAPPDISEGFTYCEVGCGHGFTTSLLAAVNPQGAFWGIDFNPSHI